MNRASVVGVYSRNPLTMSTSFVDATGMRLQVKTQSYAFEKIDLRYGGKVFYEKAGPQRPISAIPTSRRWRDLRLRTNPEELSVLTIVQIFSTQK